VAIQPCEIRFAFMARGIDGGTIFFPLIVAVSEEESATFGATIKGMENRVIAMGTSEESASMQALEMFKGIVDAAIEKQLPLGPILGDAQFTRSSLPLAKAKDVFRRLRED
jgi:hypothetical protein